MVDEYELPADQNLADDAREKLRAADEKSTNLYASTVGGCYYIRGDAEDPENYQPLDISTDEYQALDNSGYIELVDPPKLTNWPANRVLFRLR